MKTTNTTKRDALASISLFLISLPMSAGIAIASGAPPEAGIISAVFAAIFFGSLSSSPLAVYGPAAGVSVFLSIASRQFGGFSHLSTSIALSGIFLFILSYFNVYKIINIFPRSVTRGMVSGIGLILALKMIPHMLGFDNDFFYHEEFSYPGSNTITDILISFDKILPGAVIVSTVSLALILGLRKFSDSQRFSAPVVVVIIGVLMNIVFSHFYPEFYLGNEHLLHVSNTRIRFQPFVFHTASFLEILRTALVITAVIALEGFISLDVFRKIDPSHSLPDFRRESLLLGAGNFLMGILGALPVMPVFIRSAANVNFGARSRLSVLFHGGLLLIALIFESVFSFIPMASVAVVLFIVGLGLIDIREFRKLAAIGWTALFPFFVTVFCILFFDLLIGIAAGFVVGIFLTLRTSKIHSMVLVNNGDNYLLKFYKDVTFLHKNELRENLESIPPQKSLHIDGTGNIYVDPEIEEFLLDFEQDAVSRGTRVEFFKSPLAVSKLFKGDLNGEN